MVKFVMMEYKVDPDRWFKIMHEFTYKTIQTVRPNSIILKDSIDINDFVEIVTVLFSD
jgi:hypothetical protein